MPRILQALWNVALVAGGSSALAQSDAAVALDVRTISQRPGFVRAVQLIAAEEERLGIDLLLQIQEQFPDDPDLYLLTYNVACGYSRLGQGQAALVWLQAAVDQGYGIEPRHLQLLQLDVDLAAVRRLPAFAELLRQVVERFEDFQRRRLSNTLLAPFVFLPQGSAPAEGWPVLLVFHPFASDGSSFVSQYLLNFAQSRGYALIAPRGSRMLAPRRFAWALSAVDFHAQFRADSRRLLLAWQQLKDQHPLDAGRLFAVGFGQGAGLALVLGVRNPQWLKGVIALGGGYPLAPLEEWLDVSARRGLRVHFLHGQQDLVFPCAALSEFVSGLSEAGLTVRLQTVPGGHPVPEDFEDHLHAALRWLDLRED
jgi:predicted esterase